MRFLIVDPSLVFSMCWEAAEGKEMGEAHRRCVDQITRARVGFDRCVLAVDTGPSFRKVVPEYKSKRTDRGEAYREQLRRTIDRLVADGCVALPAPPIGSFPLTDKPSFAEADDVAGWAVEQYSQLVAKIAEEDMGAWCCALLSDDSDWEQLICDTAGVYVQKSALRGGEKWDEAKVREKRGVAPAQIPDLKALAGDKSDDYKGYTGPAKERDPANPEVDPGNNPGIGEGIAAGLLQKYGSALAIFDLPAASPEERASLWEAAGVKPGVRATLARHGRAVAERNLFLSTIRRDLPGLDFATVMAEPVVKPIAKPRTYDDGADLLADVTPAVGELSAPPPLAPTVVGEPVPSPAMAAHVGLALRPPSTISIQASNFDTLAFQPKDPNALWKCAETLYNSRVYAQFSNVESVFACIFEARERGVSAGVALRNAYIVKGKLAWSAAFMVALVKDSGLAKVFRIISTTSEKAVLEYQHVDDPQPMTFEFTIAEAKHAGWLKSGERGDGKWLTNPRSMLRWAAMRECVRFAWPEVVAGIYTPDERRDGRTEEGDYPDEEPEAAS
jgi:5'-3' exonuclease